MLILILLAEVFIRINNKICNIIGICLLPFVIVSGFILIKKDKKKESIWFFF